MNDVLIPHKEDSAGYFYEKGVGKCASWEMRCLLHRRQSRLICLRETVKMMMNHDGRF